MKKPSPKARGKAPRPKPFENNKVDYSKFKTDPSTSDIARLTTGIKVWPWVIEVLSPAKAIGRGRTNLTLLFPLGGDLQGDATVPYAGTGGNATVSVRFEPIAYGITSVATYIMRFNIQTFPSTTFYLGGGDVGTGTLPNAGNRTVNGSVSVGLIMKDVPPYQQTFGVLHQLYGGPWRWYSTVIEFPIIVYPPL